MASRITFPVKFDMCITTIRVWCIVVSPYKDGTGLMTSTADVSTVELACAAAQASGDDVSFCLLIVACSTFRINVEQSLSSLTRVAGIVNLFHPLLLNV